LYGSKIWLSRQQLCPNSGTIVTVRRMSRHWCNMENPGFVWTT